MTSTQQANVERVGQLRSEIKIELHTIPAIQLWLGRKQSEEKSQIFSMTRAIAHLRIIELATRIDDPYADMRLTGVYEQIAKIKKQLDIETISINEVLKSVPTGFTVSEAVSVKPVDLNLFINVSSGYQLVFLLCEFDLLVRKIQVAKHISLITGNDASERQNNVAHLLRSVITYTTKFRRPTGISRQDYRDKTDDALDAIKKYGPIADDIIEADKDRERKIVVSV